MSLTHLLPGDVPLKPQTSHSKITVSSIAPESPASIALNRLETLEARERTESEIKVLKRVITSTTRQLSADMMADMDTLDDVPEPDVVTNLNQTSSRNILIGEFGGDPSKVAEFIFDLQEEGGEFNITVGPRGWMGNMVLRVRAAMKNPEMRILLDKIAPKAQRVLDRTRRFWWKRRKARLQHLESLADLTKKKKPSNVFQAGKINIRNQDSSSADLVVDVGQENEASVKHSKIEESGEDPSEHQGQDDNDNELDDEERGGGGGAPVTDVASAVPMAGGGGAPRPSNSRNSRKNPFSKGKSEAGGMGGGGDNNNNNNGNNSGGGADLKPPQANMRPLSLDDEEFGGGGGGKRNVAPPALDALSSTGDVLPAMSRQIQIPEVRTREKSFTGPHNPSIALSPRSQAQVISVNDCIETALRFMVCDMLIHAKEILTFALTLYPNDLRLYKMIAVPYLHDQTIDWSAVRISQLLEKFDGIENPDAEVYALRGGICKTLWRLDTSNRRMAEKAVEDYLTSFKMTSVSSSETNEELLAANRKSLGFGANRSASVCAELHLSLVKSGRLSLATLYRDKCKKALQALLRYLAECKESAVDMVRKDRYFFYNIAYACFGLRQYARAGKYLTKYMRFLEGEIKTDILGETALSNDFASIAKIITFSGLPIPKDNGTWHVAWDAVRKAFQDRVKVTRELLASSSRGKVGLAFSGGGSRAVFTHLGVLARLAECDMLRSVEAISCVSGGSLVGAMYFQELKDLLESKEDQEITKEDLIHLVKRLIFRAIRGTRGDASNRWYLYPYYNLKVACGQMTRTEIGLIQYHNHFIKEAHRRNTYMRDLKIIPKGYEADRYDIKRHNWARNTKVPALYINCTTLNTGHLWRFTPTYMGEKVAFTDVSMHQNSVLLNVKYENVPAKWRNLTIAQAVTASAAVPGPLEPITLKDLYPGYTVRLADGGVYDNYGLQSLHFAGCSFIICSDASQHLADEPHPTTSVIGVLRRALGISLHLAWSRLSRELQVQQSREGLRDVCFIQMEKNDNEDSSGTVHEWNCVRAFVDENLQEETKEKKKQWESQRNILQKSEDLEHDIRRQTSDRAGGGGGGGGGGVVSPPLSPIASSNSGGSIIVSNPGSPSSHRNSQRPSFHPNPLSPSSGHRPSRPNTDIELLNVPKNEGSRHRQVSVQTGNNSGGGGGGGSGVHRLSQNPANRRTSSQPDPKKRLSLAKEDEGGDKKALLYHLLSDMAGIRTSADRFSEMEAYSLMAAGYALCTNQLKASQTAAREAADARTEIIGQDETYGESNRDPETAELIKHLGNWGNYEVFAPCLTWSFTPIHSILSMEVDSKDYKEGKINPAMLMLRRELALGNFQFGLERLIKRSYTLQFVSLVLFMALAAGLVYGLYYDYLLVGGFASRIGCLCITSSPVWFVLLFVFAVLAFVQPGFVTWTLLAVIILPAWSAFHVYLVSPILDRLGRQDRLIAIYNKHAMKKILPAEADPIEQFGSRKKLN